MIRLIKRFSVLTLTFFFNDTATTEIYTLSLHDALPIYSLALKLAELDKSSPNPPGGEFERNAAGELTGMLKEGPAMEFVRSRIPDPTAEQRRRGIISVLADLAKNGVTSVQDNSDWEDFRAYKLLKDDGKLTVRIPEWLHFTAPLNDLQTNRAEGRPTHP